MAFYVVLEEVAVSGVRRTDDEAAALSLADALAKENPGKSYVVLGSVARVAAEKPVIATSTATRLDGK